MFFVPTALHNAYGQNVCQVGKHGDAWTACKCAASWTLALRYNHTTVPQQKWVYAHQIARVVLLQVECYSTLTCICQCSTAFPKHACMSPTLTSHITCSWYTDAMLHNDLLRPANLERSGFSWFICSTTQWNSVSFSQIQHTNQIKAAVVWGVAHAL